MTMTPDRFATVRALWEAALELPPDARQAFLLDVEPHDEALRAEVLELLDAHSDTGSLLSREMFGDFGFNAATVRSAPLIGRVLGNYRVTREIGHGGMGTVYEAQRADDQFDKRVAIKTLRYDRAGVDVLKRFANERQIQAALAHPNIATLLDAGVTEEGVPYIVLEYIDGEPIDVYGHTHQLALNARLDLFLQVVKAVQHAHRQLVVHRDLKPSNILVTQQGVVKLLDFGISKLLDDSADHTATAGVRAFTTAYASPEQIRGGAVSTASDVYSLGVVLYRMLTGKNPFDLEHTTSSIAWTMICETDPHPPSLAVTPEAALSMGFGTSARLRSALRGELDAIVLMALRKEPDRRYATVDAMGEDILNHLKGRPVHARPDSAGYRVRKLVSRNRLAAGAVVVAFLAMGVGTTMSLWQLREARQSSAIAETQRVLAEQKSRTAERVSNFLQGMFSAADRSWAGQSPGAGTTIAEVIDAAALRVDRDLANEPAVAESLHRILESVYSSMLQTDKGKHHINRVLELMRARNASGVEIARGLHDLSAMYFLGGQQDSALAISRESYALFEAAGFPETEDFSLTLNQLGLTLWEAGKPEEAEPYLQRSLDVRRKVVGDDVVAAIITSNLGLIRDARGDVDGAEQRYRQAEHIYSTLGSREYFEHGVNLNNLATILLLKSQHVEAEEKMRQSLAIMSQMLGAEHASVGLGHVNLARIQLARGRTGDAYTSIRIAAKLLQHLPRDHANVARVEINEAAVLLALHRESEAEQLARHALQTRESLYPQGDWRIAETQGILGRIRLARGDVTEARQLLQQSFETFSASLGATHPRAVEVQRALLVSTR